MRSQQSSHLARAREGSKPQRIAGQARQRVLSAVRLLRQDSLGLGEEHVVV